MKKDKNFQQEYWKNFFKDKRVTVMGLGLLGRGVGDVAFIARYAKEVIVTDLKSKKDLKVSVDALSKYSNIRFVLGEHRMEDFVERDFIIKAAGVPLESPYIAHAKAHDVPVYMSTALFAKYSPATIVGVTGTRGKTTVTYMIHHILKKTYTKGRVYLGGNIRGMSTLALLPKIKKTDVIVLELDSWQLQGFGDLGISPRIAVFTTFMPDHLNYYHNDLNAYFFDKTRIFSSQKNTGTFIAGEQLCTLPQSFTTQLPKQTYFVSEKILPKGMVLKIPGEHNRYNAGLAFRVARAVGISVRDIRSALETFRGVPGRLESLGKIQGISVYNDTTSTTPHATLAALRALAHGNSVSLIFGGSDKGIDMQELIQQLPQYCAHISFLEGTGTKRFLSEWNNDVSFSVSNTLERALRDALRKTPSRGIVLFSPGFASFGMFKNEYDRGDIFVSLVKKYKKNPRA